jgi:methylase of polypeptide subunit release factors
LESYQIPLPAKRVYFNDYVFDVWKDVYEPAEDSFLFAENLKVQEAETVLDMGTGCGILGILASEKASAVVAVDVNPYAKFLSRASMGYISCFVPSTSVAYGPVMRD